MSKKLKVYKVKGQKLLSTFYFLLSTIERSPAC